MSAGASYERPGMIPSSKGGCEEDLVFADEVLTREVSGSGWRSWKVCVAGAAAVFAFAIIGTLVATGRPRSASMRQEASVGVDARAMTGFIDSDCEYGHPDASQEVILAFQTAGLCTSRGDTCNCGNWLYRERDGVCTVMNLFPENRRSL
jgi:hypothetical protein